MTTSEFASVVYVHGAGQQEHPILFKRRLDGLVFGAAQGDRTQLGYYSDVLHGAQRQPGGLERARPTDSVALAQDPTIERDELARAIAGRKGGFESGDDRRVQLAAAMLERADAVADQDPGSSRGGLEGRRFPDTGFRILVSILASDVIKYLFDGYAEAVREPVRVAVQAARDPLLVIAHSLGTIVTFDVLSEPAFADRKIQLVTLGSPLGVENVQNELHDHRGQPHPIPAPLYGWANLADGRDPVASGQALAQEFDPNGRSFRVSDDLSIRNDGFLHHALTGYLALSQVRQAIGVG